MDEVIIEAGTDVWKPENLARYLSIYYSDQVDWRSQLNRLRNQVKDSDKRRKQIGYTILSPFLHRTRPTSPIEALLFACFKFGDFNDLDWAETLEQTYADDQRPKALYGQLLSLGSIHPVEHDARCNQALRWLCEQASHDPTVANSTREHKAEVTNRFKNLIYIYGPSSICAMFQKPELKQQFISNVLNWRTGYFIEKELLRLNTDEQLLNRKDLDIQRTKKDLVTHFVTQA